jgi:hypothetical protein
MFTFLDVKDMKIPEFISGSVCDHAFLVDLTAYLNELNLKLKGKNQLVHQLYSHIETF